MEHLHGKLKMTEPIKVLRYLRPRPTRLCPNLGGAVLYFEIDYDANRVSLWTAVCSDSDNFDKSAGRTLVESRRATDPVDFEFPACYITSYKGLRYGLYHALLEAKAETLNSKIQRIKSRWQAYNIYSDWR
jgi:hypothetical protein